MGTSASIGYKMPGGKVAYVVCRFDGYLEHVGMLLVKRYNDFDKVLELLLGGDIVSLGEDLERTEHENPKNYEHPSECKAKVVDSEGEYSFIGDCDYKYLFDRGRWYVVDGVRETDGITPIKHPILVAKAIKMGYW